MAKLKFTILGHFSSERRGLHRIISLQREVVQIQRELLDYQAAKIFKLNEELEELKK